MVDRSEEITVFLTNLFVEKRETFQEVITEVNKTIKNILKLDYQYTYDDFCKDYLEIFISFFERHPNVDFMDMSMVSFYTNIILSEILLKLKIKSGYNEEGKVDENAD